jgi:hypothetical protein
MVAYIHTLVAINMREYNPTLRVNQPEYLIIHIGNLLDIAKKYKNSSSLIYACLDARIALELIDLNMILASVKPEERNKIINDTRPKNGIDRIGSKRGILKEKYQLFFQAICEVFDIEGSYYDFKKSKELQSKLSTYVHSYYMTEVEISFDSTLMQAVFPLIDEVEAFIKYSLKFDGYTYTFLGMEKDTIPDEYLTIFNDWKESRISEDELRNELEKIYLKK